MTVLFEYIKNVVKLIRRLAQVVNDVRVIPDDPEILGGGCHFCDSVNHFMRIGDAGRIRILRYAEHTLDRAVLDVFFDRVHIRTVLIHGDRNHFDAVILTDRKMSVISRRGAKEFDLALILPRRTVRTGQHTLCNVVKHHIEARVAANDDVIGGDTQKLGENRLALGNSRQNTVVSVFKAVLFAVVPVSRRDRVKKSVRNGQLIRTGLSS